MSAYKHVPLLHPRPDAAGFIQKMRGQHPSGRVPVVEFIVDETVMQPVVTELLGRSWKDSIQDPEGYWENVIAFWLHMGYDFVRIERGLPFLSNTVLAENTSGSPRPRGWADEHTGCIRTWEDFERYPWPKIEDADFSAFEIVSQRLPEGMGLVASHGGGIFEHLSWIMSYEGLCFALYDTPDLVEAIVEGIGELMTGFYRQLIELEGLVAVFPGDDFGFRSGTLIAPEDLRRNILPWHKRFAGLAHEHGLPYFLHSCGNLKAILDDLIDDVGIDGKHSFEDAILPVEQFQKQYGSRTATLGGMDVHKLATSTPDEIRRLTRRLIELCGPTGRFAIGSGNSIPDYVPVANYLAMVDEALESG